MSANILCYSGIKSCVTALLAQKGEIRYNRLVTNAQNIVSAINDLGFEASIIEDGACSDASIDLQVFIFWFIFPFLKNRSLPLKLLKKN